MVIKIKKVEYNFVCLSINCKYSICYIKKINTISYYEAVCKVVKFIEIRILLFELR